MSLFTPRRRASAVERQIEHLRDEIAELATSLGRAAGSSARKSRNDVSDMMSDFSETLGSALPALRRQSQMVERGVRNHPVPIATAAGLALLTVAAIAYLGRR